MFKSLLNFRFFGELCSHALSISYWVVGLFLTISFGSLWYEKKYFLQFVPYFGVSVYLLWSCRSVLLNIVEVINLCPAGFWTLNTVAPLIHSFALPPGNWSCRRGTVVLGLSHSRTVGLVSMFLWGFCYIKTAFFSGNKRFAYFKWQLRKQVFMWVFLLVSLSHYQILWWHKCKIPSAEKEGNT